MYVIHVCSRRPQATDSRSLPTDFLRALEADARLQSIIIDPNDEPSLNDLPHPIVAVHVHDQSGAGMAAHIAASAGCRLIVSIGQTTPPWPQDFLRKADCLVVDSRDERDALEGRLGPDMARRIVVLSPGHDFSPFDEEALFDQHITGPVERFLTRADKPALLTFAEPHRAANLTGLVTAYGADKTLQGRANLVLAIDRSDETPEARDVLRDLFLLIDHYDLWGRVALPRPYPPEDRPNLLRYAAALGGLYIAPAVYGSYDLAAIEAAAAGLPVIASRHGGAADVVQAGGHGHLVDPFNPAAFANAMSDLLDDAAAWETLATAGRRGLSVFSWQAYVDRYHDLVVAPHSLGKRDKAMSNEWRISSRA